MCLHIMLRDGGCIPHAAMYAPPVLRYVLHSESRSPDPREVRHLPKRRRLSDIRQGMFLTVPATYRKGSALKDFILKTALCNPL